MKPFNDPQYVLTHSNLVDSFLLYVKVDTQSDPTSNFYPTTERQLDLQKILSGKLRTLGCTNSRLDDNGYLYATLPGNAPDAPVIGLIAHVDTASDYSGSCVRPLIHENYSGEAIVLPNGIEITPEENPELAQCVGDTIITAAGTTLLGADDKAGVAAIMAALEILSRDPSIPHPTLRIAFTPDEEAGRGATYFDVEGFGASCAYTVDGGFSGEVNFETFSADKALVTYTGVAVHPGTAKGKMVNALRWIGRFLDLIPKMESPEATEGREGFIHPVTVHGNASEATAELLLRDFDNDALAERGRRVRALAEAVAKEEPRLKVNVEITSQYRNMADVLKSHPKVRDHLMQAVKDAGIEPAVEPVRGGTDGSGLTARGLPTPNIFMGGVNYHGPREWISTRVMAQSVCTILNLVQRWAENGK